MAKCRLAAILGHVKALVLVAALSAAIVAPGAASAAPQRTITITHVMRGCHVWDLGHGPMRPMMTITVKRGTLMKFVNNDVMPHRLVRTSGPKVQIRGGNMNRMAASATATFASPGVYRFTTVFGPFFPWAASMSSKIGKMYVLHLTVRVQ
jgi:plastocyanin